ncbi:MAG: FxLYD domain-containing protein [Bacilli bacterium]|nr:FxLYD domain-containing protein [Bacilli bacterium]
MSKEEKTNEVAEIKPQKKNRKGIIALIIVVAFIYLILPILFFAFIIFASIESTEFKSIDEKTIELPKVGMRVQVEDTNYDSKEKCFVLSTKVELFDKEKYKSNILSTDTINVNYSFLDKEGYVVGTETLYIENISKYDKWKQTISYCGEYAKNVTAYEVESVDSY